MKKYLKLLFVALFAIMTLSLASCKDDKDEPDGSNGSIIGSWEMVDGVADAMDSKQYEQFREDGTYYEVLVYSSEWAALLGKKSEVYKGTWKLEGNNLKISVKNPVTVKKVTSNELVIIEMGMEAKLKRVSDEIVNQYIK